MSDTRSNNAVEEAHLEDTNEVEAKSDASIDRGSPRVQTRSGAGLKAYLPGAVAIVIAVVVAAASWLGWRAHNLAQDQAADSAGNVASKTSIGKRRSNEIVESGRKLGADGEEAAPDANTSGAANQSRTQVPAIEQEHPRQNPYQNAGQAQPIPVQGNGQPATAPRSRYDAPMSFGSAASATGFANPDPSQPVMRGGAIISKASPGTRPDYSVPAAAPQAPPSPPPEKGSLNLNTLKTATAQASLIGNRNFILAKGGSLDCDLDTAIRSSSPGMVRCTTIKDAWSDNGFIVLAERGSTLTGEYRTDTQQGQTEIQVIWNRLRTTHGVVIDISSPAIDALGRAGIDGDVDNHWMARIGSAFLLSTIKDVLGYATATHGTNTAATGVAYGNTASSGESMANTILKQTITIPPTITRPQGTRVKVFVARDLDFSKVYDLQLNRGANELQ